MSGGGGDSTARLREAIEAFAEERAPELVAEARGEALAKARAMLSDAMAEALLAHSAEALPVAPERAPRRAPRSPRRAPRRETRRASPEKPAARASAEPAARASADPARRATSSAPEPAPRVTASSEAPLAQYVYGVVAAGAELPDDLAGVDPSHRAGPVEEGGLAAIVSPVSLGEFGEESLRDNLNDVDWLEDKARAHEAVLDAALSRTTVVPMRLCTIYSSAEQVQEMLMRERPVLLDALRRLAGRAEWGAKVVAEPGALEREAGRRAGDSGDEEEVSGGAAYMNRKRRQARAREEEGAVAEDWAAMVHERLAEVAAEALLNPVQRPEVSGHEGEMILNGVYLVEDDRVDELRSRAAALTEEIGALGVSVELTGPWPPYNFVKGSIEAAR